MGREVDWKNMFEERQNEQTKVATKKGRKRSEKLLVGDKVITSGDNRDKETVAGDGRHKRTKSFG